MKNFKTKFIFLVAVIFAAQFIFAFNCLAEGDMTGALDSLANGAGYKTDQAASDTFLAETIGSLIGKILEIIGIIFLLFMIYGGWIWMKAKGNAEQATRAKNILIDSIIGILIIMAAYIFTFFILKSLGTSVGFNFGFLL